MGQPKKLGAFTIFLSSVFYLTASFSMASTSPPFFSSPSFLLPSLSLSTCTHAPCSNSSSYVSVEFCTLISSSHRSVRLSKSSLFVLSVSFGHVSLIVCMCVFVLLRSLSSRVARIWFLSYRLSLFAARNVSKSSSKLFLQRLIRSLRGFHIELSNNLDVDRFTVTMRSIWFILVSTRPDELA